MACKRVQVLAALRKKIVPAPDEAALVLVGDKVEVVSGPRLRTCLKNLFKRHLALGLGDDVLDDDLGGDEVEVPNIAKRHGHRRDSACRA